VTKREIKSYKGDESGGRSEWLPGIRITKADLALFNELRGSLSSADFLKLLLYFYRDNKPNG